MQYRAPKQRQRSKHKKNESNSAQKTQEGLTKEPTLSTSLLLKLLLPPASSRLQQRPFQRTDNVAPKGGAQRKFGC